MIRQAMLPLALALGMVQMAAAQTTGFGNAQDIKAPVEVTADSLQVDQKSGLTIFSGNVLIGQGAMRLSADKVSVTYTAGDARRISALRAEGNVTLVSGQDAAEAQSADYDVDQGNVILRGDVLLTQGNNVLAGETVTVNLETGTANATGRVRSVLQPEGN